MAHLHPRLAAAADRHPPHAKWPPDWPQQKRAALLLFARVASYWLDLRTDGGQAEKQVLSEKRVY